jgi:hypothetical protein
MPGKAYSARAARLAALRPIWEHQAGVVSRRQLRAVGWSRHNVAHEITFGRWTVVAPEVVALQNAPLTPEQMLWLGVLHAGPGSALSHRTACEQHKLTGWEGEQVEVLMPKSHTIERLPGFVFHETRRDFRPWLHPAKSPPTLALEYAALLTAERQKRIPPGIGILAACVQQRLTTAERLFSASTSITKLRHGHHFRLALWDIEGGSHSFSEIDAARKCIAFGLVPPSRQRIRCDASGRRRYLDLEWDLPDGSVIILEVDGSFHLKVANWWRDMKRERRVVVNGPKVLRCSTIEVRHEFADVAADLRQIGVPLVSPFAA